MALRKREEVPREPSPAVPPPVGDGYDFVQSLGGVIDDAMGHARDGKSVKAYEVLERPIQGDPEPIELPPPVPDGGEISTRGAGPDNLETK